MQYRVTACITLIVLASCRDAVDAPPPTILRVSAGNELSRFDPQHWTGSTSYALDLVYERLSEHATVAGGPGASVSLRRKPETPHTLDTLCEGVYYEGITRRAVDGERCILELESVAARERFVAESIKLVEVGPFRLDRVLAPDGQPLPAGDAGADARVGAIELVACDGHGGTALDRIRILAMPIHEEWRRLFSGEIDVIPSMPVLYRARFAGMRSVRTIELPPSGHVSLFFNTKRAPWTNRELRRHVAALVDREAVAMLACGEPGCSAPFWTAAPPTAAAVELPSRFSILVLASHTPGLITARAISYQLRKHQDTVIDIEVLPLQDMFERAQRGDFDLQIAPLGFLSSSDAVITRDVLAYGAAYEHAELERALRAGEEARARQILAADVPVLPLYENRKFAAVDTYFCGGAPSNQVSWAWLADLYPCEEDAPR